ncbi:MAG: hypothetical protein IT566_00645 [Rhodospirillaceae bacterium]|nr:hypothetical protein [Rhodospirillaceae bacterium]
MSAGASTAYQLGRATSGQSGFAGVGAGFAGMARAGAGVMNEWFKSTVSPSAQAGRQGAWRATGGAASPSPGASSPPAGDGAPDWARTMRAEQRGRANRAAAAQAVKEGDKPGGAANPDLSEGEQ